MEEKIKEIENHVSNFGDLSSAPQSIDTPSRSEVTKLIQFISDIKILFSYQQQLIESFYSLSSQKSTGFNNSFL
jgi:hypothetical protein